MTNVPVTTTEGARTWTAPPADALRKTEPLLGRVAFLTNFIPPYRTSTLAALGERCRHLRILISTPMEANRQGWTAGWDGLEVVVQKTRTLKRPLKHPQRRDEANYVHLPIDTLSALRTFDAAVVISQEMGFRSLLALLHRRLSGKGVLLIWADIAESTELRRGLLRRLLRNVLCQSADAFIVNGASGARYLKQFGVPSSRLFTIPYATDIARFYQRDCERAFSDVRRFLFVGQLIERKGLMPFLEVLSRWAIDHPTRRMTLTVAGDGPVRSQVEAITLPPNLELKLLGTVAYENLPAVYREAEVLVLPTFADTWGLVVNEAMASGLPVLGSLGAQAVEELVKEGITGWSFDPHTAAEAYTALDRCMNTSRETLRAMQANAQRVALGISPAHVADRIQNAVLACLPNADQAESSASHGKSSTG